MQHQPDPADSILLFDGICNLCSGFVQFVLKYEKSPVIRFASLQSPIGESIIKKHKITRNGLESIVFIENDKAYEKSEAVLKISRYLKFPWSSFVASGIIPLFIRNWVYDMVAANRYRIFGKQEVCWVPDPKWKNRFID